MSERFTMEQVFQLAAHRSLMVLLEQLGLESMQKQECAITGVVLIPRIYHNQKLADRLRAPRNYV